MNFIRKVYDWMGKKVYSKYANLWLAGLFFIEAVFFIPVDPLLILFCVQNNKKSLKYATIATLSSVTGGVVAYGIGKLMWDTVGINLVKWVISETAFNTAVLKYKLYQNWAVLIAGFTPLPYKAVTLSAGFCGLSLAPFILYSFFLVAGSIRIWGPQIKIFIDRYFNQLVILFTIILIASVWLLK